MFKFDSNGQIRDFVNELSIRQMVITEPPNWAQFPLNRKSVIASILIARSLVRLLCFNACIYVTNRIAFLLLLPRAITSILHFDSMSFRFSFVFACHGLCCGCCLNFSEEKTNQQYIPRTRVRLLCVVLLVNVCVCEQLGFVLLF